MDIDSYVDTHCFGRNFRPIVFKFQQCTVSTFLEKYTEKINIPICSAWNEYTLESGETVILVFGQGLWFGNMHVEVAYKYQ